MILSVNEVSKKFGNQIVLDNVSFNIGKGEIVGFIGPNGAGKSTMMKIISGIIPPTIGSIEIEGNNIFEKPIETRRLIGYLPENNPLYPNMYVKEFLSFVARLYKLGKNSKKRVDEMIEVTGLAPEVNKKIGILSKGYKQRVGIAQVLLHNPHLLILDEPTSGLDPNQIIEIRNLIKNISSDKAVMLSTHIMQEVEAICQRIILINKGKIIANTFTSEISSSSHTLIIEFNKKVEKEFFNIDGVTSVVEHNNNIWLIECLKNTDIREIIFNKAVENNISVLGLQRKEKRLEEVFHELTLNS